MYKFIGVTAGIFTLLVGGMIVLATVDFNRLGKEHLYVQISADSEIEETRLDSGQIATRYWYELPAFDEEGNMIMVEFSAARELRADAYLMLYVKNGNHVTSYDEVKWGDIPAAAQEKLGQNED